MNRVQTQADFGMTAPIFARFLLGLGTWVWKWDEGIRADKRQSLPWALVIDGWYEADGKGHMRRTCYLPAELEGRTQTTSGRVYIRYTIMP